MYKGGDLVVVGSRSRTVVVLGFKFQAERGKRNDGDAYYRQSGNLAIAHLQSPSKRSSAGGARRGG